MPLTTTFPQEIFDLFIDCRSNDPRCLSRFSLVARAWTIGARRHLFRHIVFTNDNRAEAFLCLFRSHPATFARHIQELDFMNRENAWQHPNLSLSWRCILRVISQLNEAEAHNVHSMTLSKLTDVEARPEMRTQLLGNVGSLQLQYVQFYDHNGLRQFLTYFTGLQSLEIEVPPTVPLVASAPIDELDILSPDVLSQLRSLNLSLAFRSPLLSWFARNTSLMHRLSECTLSLDSDVLVQHSDDLGKTLTSLAPSLHELVVQFYILPRSITPGKTIISFVLITSLNPSSQTSSNL